ncbi:NUDIX hydrolase [Dictyobacter aurantiacus]|uniref:8-oxo-dGTP diphosphatase n=1 Tax=Dictyobacter aurantiacus TaxID=1936993 RepID=A0A401ZP23_9CHLR|nr:NUDIX domain-containing protein [Dictyobacter aurantiacus]GCE08603.1 DNA mismatch repair protein MutT [Dictyobacter aurantiacus]
MTNTIDKLAWIQITDKRLLATRSRGKDLFYLPGGKREPGETDRAALVREVQEELSVALEPETVSYFDTFTAQAHGKAAGTVVISTCYQADYTGQLQAANEIEEVTWLSYQERNRCSNVLQIVMDSLKNKGMIA